VTSKLRYLTKKTHDNLKSSIRENLDLYQEKGFVEYADDIEWSIKLESFDVDLGKLNDLKTLGDSKLDEEAALIVWKALYQLPASIACEARIWCRLAHVECFEYTQDRWGKSSADDDVVIANINKHFFSNGRTGYRDDNAIGRLWWAAYIAKLAYPEDHGAALSVILKTTDLRSNYIERPDITNRLDLAAGIIHTLLNNKWVAEKEAHWRAFFVAINKFGSGVIFELWSREEVDRFVLMCSERARKGLES